MERPEDLHEAGIRLWDGIAASRSIDATTYALVLNACRIADRLDEMAESTGSLTSENDKGDVVANPLIVESRQQAMALRQLLSSLGIGELDHNSESEEDSLEVQITRAMMKLRGDQ